MAETPMIPPMPAGPYLASGWHDADDGRTYPISDPATGEVIAMIADDGPAEALYVLDAAIAAQLSSAVSSPRLIATAIGRFGDESRAEVASAAKFFRPRRGGTPLAPAMTSRLQKQPPVPGGFAAHVVDAAIDGAACDEAIERANDTPFGSIDDVPGREVDRCRRPPGRRETGMVAVYRGAIAKSAAPGGEAKHSGLSRESGAQGLEAYFETQCVELP